MNIKTKDIELLKRINSYLHHSTDLIIDDLVYKTPSQRLREQADLLEKKDVDINDFRKLIQRLD